MLLGGEFRNYDRVLVRRQEKIEGDENGSPWDFSFELLNGCSTSSSHIGEPA